MNQTYNAMNEYPHTHTTLAAYGPQAIEAFSNIANRYLQLEETRAIVQGNLALVERRLQVFNEAKTDAAEAHRVAQKAFMGLVDLARELKDAEATKLLLPAFIHLMNKTPDFLGMGLKYLDKAADPQKTV